MIRRGNLGELCVVFDVVEPRASLCSTRREFLGRAAACIPVSGLAADVKPVVSIVKIQRGRTEAAVEEAIELLGGVTAITRGKSRVMLKPNLVAAAPEVTTKLPIIRALARLMKSAHKEVSIGEGSAAAEPFNVRQGVTYRTSDRKLLEGLQRSVFERLGYEELSKAERIPLVNLHTGDLVEVRVPNALRFEKLTMHRSLAEIDLLCSVPMMKTHVLAGVTLGMKNLIGLFPGAVYQSLRGRMHDMAADVEPSATAAPILDMVRANKLGLVIIDGSSAMEGNGPTDGTLLPMDTIIAGTNPLATDMVAASVMGFATCEVSTFRWAHRLGMRPATLDEIEIRGQRPDQVRHEFVRPFLVPWSRGVIPELNG